MKFKSLFVAAAALTSLASSANCIYTNGRDLCAGDAIVIDLGAGQTPQYDRVHRVFPVTKMFMTQSEYQELRARYRDKPETFIIKRATQRSPDELFNTGRNACLSGNRFCNGDSVYDFRNQNIRNAELTKVAGVNRDNNTVLVNLDGENISVLASNMITKQHGQNLLDSLRPVRPTRPTPPVQNGVWSNKRNGRVAFVSSDKGNSELNVRCVREGRGLEVVFKANERMKRLTHYAELIGESVTVEFEVKGRYGSDFFDVTNPNLNTNNNIVISRRDGRDLRALLKSGRSVIVTVSSESFDNFGDGSRFNVGQQKFSLTRSSAAITQTERSCR